MSNLDIFVEALKKREAADVVARMFANNLEQAKKVLQNESKDAIITMLAMTMTDIEIAQAKSGNTIIGNMSKVLKDAGLIE